MAAQGADREAVVRELLFKINQLVRMLEHRQFAMRIARIIACAEFDRADVERGQFFEDLLQRQAGKQRREDTDVHSKAPSDGTFSTVI